MEKLSKGKEVINKGMCMMKIRHKTKQRKNHLRNILIFLEKNCMEM